MSPYRYPYFGLHLAMKTVGASSNFLQTLRSLSPRTLALFERSEFAKFLGRASACIENLVFATYFRCGVACWQPPPTKWKRLGVDKSGFLSVFYITFHWIFLSLFVGFLLTIRITIAIILLCTLIDLSKIK
jgi:hypothetical protein